MRVKKTTIPLKDTNQFSKLITDYISDANALSDFIETTPAVESYGKLIDKYSDYKVDRSLLRDTIKQQYVGLNTSELNIDALAETNTFTVCTGHQLCLFTGPLYFIYKIITTINLAEKLKEKYPENKFVPMYWMASEDHDFEEIQSINLFGKKITWNNPSAKGAVGRLGISSFKDVVEELRVILGNGENAKQLLEIFEKAYLETANLSDATRILVHELFGKYGLIVLDADDKALKASFSSYIANDLFEATNYSLVEDTIEKLQFQGIKAQVTPRPINCFYLIENSRERIVFDETKQGFEVLNTDLFFTKQALTDELKKYPERFSPNVVLRPLYQQAILPNLAYVGGPGELAYWFEYKSMFQANNVPFPILMPRNFATLLDEKQSALRAKLELAVIDIFKEKDTLIKEYVIKNSGEALSFNEASFALKKIYSSIVENVNKIDKTLVKSVEAELHKSLKGISTLEGKLLRSEKKKQEIDLNQLSKLMEQLFPNNGLQERYDNFIPYYLKYGRGFIDELKNNLKPFEHDMCILEVVKQ